MATLEELTAPLTKDDIESAIYAAIEARGVATTSWKPGAVVRTIIAGTSIVLAAFSTLQARLAESGFLELAEGDWLDSVAKFVYGVTRDTGSFASGNVTFSNSGAGVFAPAIGDVIVSNSTTGKTYTNTAAFTLAAFEVGVIVPMQAVEIGADSTSPTGFIDTLVTALSGVTVTNASALVGTDADTDPELREKCLAKTGTLSPNGPADAYRFVAFAATKDDGTPTGVTRLTTVPDGEGNVVVYVADGDGTLTGSIGDTTTDLGAVDEAIQTQCVPLAVTATTTAATPLSNDVTYEVWVDGTIGLTGSELSAKIATALTNFHASHPIGGAKKVAGAGFIFKQAIEAVIAEAVGSGSLIDKSITTPAADVPVAPTEAPVVGTITPTINIVSL